MLPGHDFEENIDAGMLAGTPEYIAPESVMDARNTDPNAAVTDTPADLFGLGVIFYELLSGEPPWPFRPDAGTLEQYQQQTRDYLDQRVLSLVPAPPLPNVSPALWSIMHRALNPDPKKRQGDAMLLHADIRRYVRYGVGVPSDLDQEATVMAYLSDIGPTQEPEHRVSDSRDKRMTPRGPIEAGSFRKEQESGGGFDWKLALLIGGAVGAGVLFAYLLN